MKRGFLALKAILGLSGQRLDFIPSLFPLPLCFIGETKVFGGMVAVNAVSNAPRAIASMRSNRPSRVEE